MKKSDTHAFVNQLLVYTLGLICFSGSVGMGTVWLRHRISESANAARVMESRIREVERHIDEYKAEIVAAQNPAVLEQLNRQWQLGLQRATPAQVVHVGADPVQTLAAKRNREIFTDSPAAVSVRLSLRN
jgi:hypothetical protein